MRLIAFSIRNPFLRNPPHALCLLSVLAVSSDLGTEIYPNLYFHAVDLLFRLYKPRTRFFTVSVLAM